MIMSGTRNGQLLSSWDVLSALPRSTIGRYVNIGEYLYFTQVIKGGDKIIKNLWHRERRGVGKNHLKPSNVCLRHTAIAEVIAVLFVVSSSTLSWLCHRSRAGREREKTHTHAHSRYTHTQYTHRVGRHIKTHSRHIKTHSRHIMTHSHSRHIQSHRVGTHPHSHTVGVLTHTHTHTRSRCTHTHTVGTFSHTHTVGTNTAQRSHNTLTT